MASLRSTADHGRTQTAGWKVNHKRVLASCAQQSAVSPPAEVRVGDGLEA
jgi:hypothetical protein